LPTKIITPAIAKIANKINNLSQNFPRRLTNM